MSDMVGITYYDFNRCETDNECLLEQNSDCLPSLEASDVGIWEGFDEALDMINGEW